MIDTPAKGEIRQAYMIQRRLDHTVMYPLGFYWSKDVALTKLFKEHGNWGDVLSVEVVWDGTSWRQLFRQLNIQ